MTSIFKEPIFTTFTLIFFTVVILTPDQISMVRKIACLIVMLLNTGFLLSNPSNIIVQFSAVVAAGFGLYTSLLPLIE